jgi:hypothetical protein
MIQLYKYFRILFLSPQINRERLKLFCEKHIQLLTSNNPGGIFTTILTDVTNSYNAYYGDMASKSVNLAVQEGLTAAMEESRTALVKNISDGERLVKYTYRDNVAFYQEFYPQGITEYHKADLPSLETITDRYRNRLTAHSADFPPAFINDFTLVRGTFMSNRTAQLAAMGTVTGEISDLATTKPALAKQLTTNLLTIALEYVGDESKAAVYFDQAILDAAFREADRRVTNEINPGDTDNVFDNVSSPDVRISIKSESEDTLVGGFVSSPNAVPTQLNIAAGIEIILNAAELGWTSENKFFNISNGSGIAGKYTVEKL